MATWIAHMRIAEHFMGQDQSLNNAQFLVGNIGPDCGVPNEDWSAFTPNTDITHWRADGVSIDADGFRNKYLRFRDSKYPFYLGYYFHLLTDIEWGKFAERKKRAPLYADGLKADKRFIWTIKKDWYGQDHLYLKRNPDSVFFNVFARIDGFANEYLDYYPDDAFTRQVKHITNFYLSAHENPDREFPFLSKDEMDDFVDGTITTVEGIYHKDLRDLYP